MVSWPARLVLVRELFFRSERVSDARGHWSVPVGDSWQPIVEDPELTKRQGDWDGQEEDLVARLVAPLCSSVGRRFRKLVRIHKQSPDIAGGAHVGNYNLLATKASCSDMWVVRLSRGRKVVILTPHRRASNAVGGCCTTCVEVFLCCDFLVDGRM